MNKVKLLGRKLSMINSIYLLLIVFGIGCISWSMISILNHDDYSIDSSQSLNSTQANISEEQYKLKIDNSTAKPAADKALYPIYPVEGDNIGSLTIPALKQKLPIIQGTGVNELKEGVGHFTQSVLPGEEDNCVLSGHRDTVFRQLGTLKIEDQLIVQTSAGIFTYEVNGTRIVDKDDKTVIVPTDGAVLTMTTCYPFNFIGDAPDRYIVTATLMK
jgi:sortase A